MPILFRRLTSISLLWQILVPILLCVAIGIAVVQVWTVRNNMSLLQERLTASLSANLAMLQADVEGLGTGLHRDGDRLLVGNTVVNGRNDIVDRVAAIAGGVATIFSGETRVATTIRNADGGRAIGTTLAAGPARTASLDGGQTYRGTATILGQDYVTIYQPLKDATGTGIGLLFVGIPTAPTEAALAASEHQTLYISLVALGVLGLVVGFLLRRVLSPLVAMTRAMHQLANGDLTTEIPAMDRKDEVGRMAAALDVFKRQGVESVRLAHERQAQRAHAEADKRAALLAMADLIETEAGASVEAVSHETERMAETTDRLAAAAARAGADAKTASESADEALVNTQTVASAAEELSASIREIAAQVGRSTEIVGRAVHTGQAAQETIVALTGRVAQIGTVAGLIADIAAQTNLLALNATIEAARAGDAGKGFAVVASEVKALAIQTTRSTEQISLHIEAVRAATDGTVQAVGQIEAAITEIDHVGAAIAAAVEQQGAATEEIARSVARTSQAAREVASRVAGVSSEAVQSGSQAVEVHQHLAELGRHVAALKQTVVRIARTSTQEVDRRREDRALLDRPARMTLVGSATACAVRLTNLSRHGVAVIGGPAAGPGARGTLSIEGADAALAFVVRQSEATAEGAVLHLEFSGDTQSIDLLLPKASAAA